MRSIKSKRYHQQIHPVLFPILWKHLDSVKTNPSPCLLISAKLQQPQQRPLLNLPETSVNALFSNEVQSSACLYAHENL